MRNITITIILPGAQAVTITWGYGGGHNTKIQGPQGETSCHTVSPDEAVRVALKTFVGL